MTLTIPIASLLLKHYRHGAHSLICPNCGARQLNVVLLHSPFSQKPFFHLACRDCGFTGPQASSLETAFADWETLVGRFARRLMKIIQQRRN